MSKNMKAYLRDHLRANLKSLLYIIVFALAATFVLAFTGQITEDWKGNTEYAATLGVPVFVLVVCCYVIPVVEFAIFKKRTNLDCLYALPISRKEMAAVHYITGLITLVVPYTLSYLLNALLLLRAPEAFQFLPLIPHFCISLALGVNLYSIYVFVFNEANTKGDGIWFIVLWTFIVSLTVLALDAFSRSFNFTSYYSFLGITWAPLAELTSGYNAAMVGYAQQLELSSEEPHWLVFWLVFWLLAGIAATVGFFRNFGKQRTEKTEEVSSSVFGYKLLIPLYAVTGMIVFETSEFPGFWLIIEALALLGYTIYRRGFHYKKSDIIILACLFLFLFI